MTSSVCVVVFGSVCVWGWWLFAFSVHIFCKFVYVGWAICRECHLESTRRGGDNTTAIIIIIIYNIIFIIMIHTDRVSLRVGFRRFRQKRDEVPNMIYDNIRLLLLIIIAREATEIFKKNKRIPVTHKKLSPTVTVWCYWLHYDPSVNNRLLLPKHRLRLERNTMESRNRCNNIQLFCCALVTAQTQWKRAAIIYLRWYAFKHKQTHIHI